MIDGLIEIAKADQAATAVTRQEKSSDR